MSKLLHLLEIQLLRALTAVQMEHILPLRCMLMVPKVQQVHRVFKVFRDDKVFKV